MFGNNSPILICIAAIFLNLFGAFIARTLELPLYLDTGGTILIAMMSGYVPGVVVGFVTHFFASLANESDMYYCSVSIFIAICTTFLARRGWFRSFLKMFRKIMRQWMGICKNFMVNLAMVYLANECK